jgi:hypothetical protein
MTPEQIAQMKADMADGTPGPFYVQEGFGNIYALSDGTSGLTICISTVDRRQLEGGLAEAAANARRIARVPDMEAEILILRAALERIAGNPELRFSSPEDIARAALNGAAP